MNTVRIKARNIMHGDVWNGQRVGLFRIFRITERDRAHRNRVQATYLLLKKKDGTGLELKRFDSDEFIVVKRPKINMKKRKKPLQRISGTGSTKPS